MHTLSKRLLSFFVVLGIISLYLPFNITYAYSERVYGTDRYKTAVAISQKGWSSSYYAVLARGDDFPDALCAGPLAQKYNAPILLTESGRLNSDVLTELRRLGVTTVFIVGGTGAVSLNVEYELRNAGIYNIERIYGSDRYETSAKIAEKLGWTSSIVLATGNNFPDALSISAIASKKGMPILLTEKDSLPYTARQYIQNRSISQTYIIGGTGVISDWVRYNVPGPVRLGGTDRYDTNVLIMQQFASELDFSKVYIAVGEGPTGDEFADALAGAVLAAKSSAPLVLAGKTLPSVTSNYLRYKISPITRITALGGEGVVPWSVVSSLEGSNGQYQTGYVAATYNSPGTYGPYSGTNTVNGDVVINASEVTLQNMTIEGNLVLGENIGLGNVYFRNVTVRGTTTVKGGGPNSVNMYDFYSQYMVVDAYHNNVRLLAQGNTNINYVTMQSGGRLEEYLLTGNGFIAVTVPDTSPVTLAGNFGTVSMDTSGANVNIESGRVIALNVGTSASGSRITVSSGTYVDTMTLDATATVNGQGTVYTANINVNGTYFEKRPLTQNLASNVSSYLGQYPSGYPYDNYYNYDTYVPLNCISSTITINANESYNAYSNISYLSGTYLTFESSNSSVTVNSDGIITSSTPGAYATITITGVKSGYRANSAYFQVQVSSNNNNVNTATVNSSTELTNALNNNNITTIYLASDITNLTSAVTVPRLVTVDGQNHTINAGLNITGSGATVKNLRITMAPSAPATTLATSMFGNYTNSIRRAVVWVDADNVKLQNLNLNISDNSSIYGTEGTIGQGIGIHRRSGLEITSCSITMHDTNIVGGVPQYSKEFIGIYISQSPNASISANTITEGSYGFGVDTAGGGYAVSFTLLSGNAIGSSCLRPMYIIGESTNTDYNTTVSTLKTSGSLAFNTAGDLVIHFKGSNTSDNQKSFTYVSSNKSINRSLRVTGGVVQVTVNAGDINALNTALADSNVGSINITSDITTGTVIIIPDRTLTISADTTRTIAVQNVTKANPSSSLTLTNVSFVAVVSNKSQLNNALSGIANTVKLGGNINDLTDAVSVTRTVIVDGSNYAINAGIDLTATGAVVKNLKIDMVNSTTTTAINTNLFGDYTAGSQRAVVWVDANNVELNGLQIDITDYGAAYGEYGKAIGVNSKSGVKIKSSTIAMNDSENNINTTTFTAIYLSHATDAEVTSNTVSKAKYGVGVDVTQGIVSFVTAGLNGNTIGADCIKNMLVVGNDANACFTKISTINLPGLPGQTKSAIDLMSYFEDNNSENASVGYRYESMPSRIKSLDVSSSDL